MESNAIALPALAVAPAIIAAPVFVQDQPVWVQLLCKEIGSHKRGKAAVADLLGVKRAYVSRVIATLEGRSSGFPKGVPGAFQQRVIDRLHVIRECPATIQPQPVTECQRIAHGAAPTHNPQAMRIWSECQRCVYKPTQPEKE